MGQTSENILAMEKAALVRWGNGACRFFWAVEPAGI